MAEVQFALLQLTVVCLQDELISLQTTGLSLARVTVSW